MLFVLIDFFCMYFVDKIYFFYFFFFCFVCCFPYLTFLLYQISDCL